MHPSKKKKKPHACMHDEDSVELNHSHSTLLMLASFPVRISHGELILIRQHRRHHRVRGPGYALTRFFLLGPIHCHCCPCVDQQTKLSSVKSVWMKKNINIARNVIWLVPWSFYYMQNMNACWELKTNIKWLSFPIDRVFIRLTNLRMPCFYLHTSFLI